MTINESANQTAFLLLLKVSKKLKAFLWFVEFEIGVLCYEAHAIVLKFAVSFFKLDVFELDKWEAFWEHLRNVLK